MPDNTSTQSMGMNMSMAGGDFFIFEGAGELLDVVLVNPYSGNNTEIYQQVNMNTSAYYGGTGYDILFMTNLGDALFITDQFGNQVFGDIEEIVAGGGDDIIILSHEDIELGDLSISAGHGDDIIWSNVGNDTLDGGNGNDIIDGGPGNDVIYGGNDHDLINGGDGDDRIHGDSGDDVLYGDMGADTIFGGFGNDVLYGGSNGISGQQTLDKDFTDDVVFPALEEGVDIHDLSPSGAPALGIHEGNLSVDFAAQATITFRESQSNYDNAFGVYRIAADGTIEAVQMVWDNVKAAGFDTPHVVDLPVGPDGGDFAFFTFASGWRLAPVHTQLDITQDGVLQFVYDYGGPNERPANITDSGQDVSLLYDDGTTVRVLQGYHSHTTTRGDSDDLNWDGEMHVVSGLVNEGDHDVLRIGFEDPMGRASDHDFRDVVFDVDIVPQTTGAYDAGHDILVGGVGDDVLYGEQGDDILMIGDGADQAYGGQGADQFVFDTFDAQIDLIHDFEIGQDGDVLNITDILIGYDATNDALSDFIQLVDTGEDMAVMINADGQGSDFMQVAMLIGIDTTLNEMLDQIVADQHVII